MNNREEYQPNEPNNHSHLKPVLKVSLAALSAAGALLSIAPNAEASPSHPATGINISADPTEPNALSTDTSPTKQVGTVDTYKDTVPRAHGVLKVIDGDDYRETKDVAVAGTNYWDIAGGKLAVIKLDEEFTGTPPTKIRIGEDVADFKLVGKAKTDSSVAKVKSYRTETIDGKSYKVVTDHLTEMAPTYWNLADGKDALVTADVKLNPDKPATDLHLTESLEIVDPNPITDHATTDSTAPAHTTTEAYTIRSVSLATKLDNADRQFEETKASIVSLNKKIAAARVDATRLGDFAARTGHDPINDTALIRSENRRKLSAEVAVVTDEHNIDTLIADIRAAHIAQVRRQVSTLTLHNPSEQASAHYAPRSTVDLLPDPIIDVLPKRPLVDPIIDVLPKRPLVDPIIDVLPKAGSPIAHETPPKYTARAHSDAELTKDVPTLATGPSPLMPEDGNNPQTAINFLVDNGFTLDAAAGIVGNWTYESSGVNPSQLEIGSGAGLGIAQFTGAERGELNGWAKEHNESPTSLQTQLDYSLYDIKTHYPSVFTAINKAGSVRKAAEIYENGYERPAIPLDAIGTRTQYGESEMIQYEELNGGKSNVNKGSDTIHTDKVKNDPPKEVPNLFDPSEAVHADHHYHHHHLIVPNLVDPNGSLKSAPDSCGSGEFSSVVGSNSQFEGIDQGIDFSPSVEGAPYNVCAPASGTITTADQTGHKYERTTGEALVIEKLNHKPNVPNSSRYIYWAELFKLAPGLNVGEKVKAGQVIGTNNEDPGIEMGWGTSSTEGFMCNIGLRTACGMSFYNWAQQTSSAANKG